MKKILIICRYFGTQTVIGAVRPTKIAKYLNLNYNCEISVFMKNGTRRLIDEKLYKNMNYVKRVYNVPSFFILSKIPPFFILFHRMIKRIGGSNFLLSNLNKCIRSLYCYTNILEGKKIATWINKEVKKSGIKYDMIFTTYGPYYTTLAGELLKKEYPDVFWVSDYRDPVIDNQVLKRSLGSLRQFVNLHCKQADLITAVSQGTIDRLFLDENIIRNLPTVVIPNGYDPDDLVELEIQKKSSRFFDGLSFAYTGTMFVGRSYVTSIFKVLRELINESKVDENRIKVFYAGSEGYEMKKQAGFSNLKHIVVDYGYISKTESIQLQVNSDMLIMASWNYPDHYGVVTGKVYEYMMSKRPIIAAISGGLPNSTIKEMIESMSLGICYEEATAEADYIRLKKYILDQYQCKLSKGKVLYNGNEELMNQYRYENIVKILVEKYTEFTGKAF